MRFTTTCTSLWLHVLVCAVRSLTACACLCLQLLCNGKGTCPCGRCQCDETTNYMGPTCEEYLVSTCPCGRCQCDETTNYMGPTCEECLVSTLVSFILPYIDWLLWTVLSVGRLTALNGVICWLIDWFKCCLLIDWLDHCWYVACFVGFLTDVWICVLDYVFNGILSILLLIEKGLIHWGDGCFVHVVTVSIFSVLFAPMWEVTGTLSPKAKNEWTNKLYFTTVTMVVEQRVGFFFF